MHRFCTNKVSRFPSQIILLSIQLPSPLLIRERKRRTNKYESTRWQNKAGGGKQKENDARAMF